MPVNKEVVFETIHDMYFAIMKWERATIYIAVDIVGDHYTDECFTKSLLYWLDPQAERWKKKFYNGFNGFQKAYFTKVRRICKDMLRSPYCAGKKKRYLSRYSIPAPGWWRRLKAFRVRTLLTRQRYRNQ